MDLTRNEVIKIAKDTFLKNVSNIQYNYQKEEISCTVQFSANMNGCANLSLLHVVMRDPYKYGKDAITATDTELYDSERHRYITACAEMLGTEKPAPVRQAERE